MNKSLITTLSIFGIIAAILGLLFSFLPISNLAIFPAALGLILGLIAYLSAKKKQLNFSFARVVVLLSLLAIIISMSKQLFTENKVADDTEFIEKTNAPTDQDLKDIEELDEDLDGLE